MSDIRYNQWLHNSGTGGVSQDAGGNIGIGTTAPLIPVGAGNTAILNVGVVTCNSIEVTGNVSVGGTLTYQDVTNIDSVGIVTARAGIIDSTLTAGRVVYVDSDKSLTDSANLTFNGNNVTLEEGRLFVKRSTIPSVDVRNSTNTSYSRVILQQGAAEGGYFQISREGTNSSSGAGSNSVELNQSSNHPLTIKTNNTERLRIVGDGKILVGHTTARIVSTSVNAFNQIEGTTYHESALSITRNTDDQWGGYVIIGKSRGTSVGGIGTLTDGDTIGEFRFAACDGTDMVPMTALIRSQIDGAVGVNSTPGDLSFRTTAAGNVSTTERLRIKSDGNIEAGGNLKTNNITGKNMVINGSFQVDQRNDGAEISITSNTIFSADRWTHNNDGHTYYKTQRKNDGPIQTIGTEYYLRATITTALSQGGGANSQVIENNLEGNTVRWLNLGTSGAKQCTLSCWVRSSLTGTFGGALVNSAYNRCHPFSYTISSANTWEYKTFTFSTTGFTTGSFLTNNGVGLRLCFSLGNGTGRSASADQWHSSVKFGPTGETCLVATNGATMDIASVQLEEGTQATRFDHKSYAEELRLCQRYCFRLGGGDTEVGTTLAMAVQSHSTTCKAHIQFPVTMRSKDLTYTISDLTLDDDVVGYSASRVNSISSDQSSTTSSTLIFNTDSMGTVRATRVVADSVGGYIQAECEL